MLGDLGMYFFARIEGDGQILFCLMSISLLFYPLTPFGHGHVVQFFPALSRFFRVFVVQAVYRFPLVRFRSFWCL